MQTIKTIVKVALFLSVFVLSTSLHIAQAESPLITKEERFDLEMNAWINKLAHCESGGNPKAINPDDGGSRSVGLLQFKDGTYKAFTNRYKLPYKPEDIWNGDKQRELAKLILTQEKSGWRHWTNCAKKTGVEKLNIILGSI